MWKALGRALLLRCTHCGSGGVVTGPTRMRATCPGCGLRFERQEGYWLGAIAINTAATLGVFTAVFTAGMILTWPEVPWTALTIVAVAINVVFPIAFLPWSRTLWLALETRFRPIGPDEAAPQASE